MKKFYFSLVAAMMLSASTAAAQDGKTCETAKPFPGMLMGMQVTETQWYTVTVSSLSMFPSSQVFTNQAEITIFEGCGGEEATPNDVNCYFLYPDIEYKMRIVPKEDINGMMIMGATSIDRAPEGIYCVKPIVWPDNGFGGYAAIKQPLGTTRWYQRNVAYNGNLTFTKNGWNPLDIKITKVEVKREDCREVSNISEGQDLGTTYIAPTPYAKAGTDLIAVTIAASDDPDITEGQFFIAQTPATDCNNRPEKMSLTKLGTETTITNGYVVKDYAFAPETSGTYSFVCKAAEGTIINVGTIVNTGEKRDPGTQYESDIYECRYELTDPVIINSTNEGVITLDLVAGTKYVLHYDSDYKLEGATPSMKTVEGTYSSINSIEMNKKTDVMVSENPTDGNFTVSSYLLPDCGEIALYDMGANKVFSTKSQGGKEQNIQLTGVKSGAYLLVVYGCGRSACTKLIVK